MKSNKATIDETVMDICAEDKTLHFDDNPSRYEDFSPKKNNEFAHFNNVGVVVGIRTGRRCDR